MARPICCRRVACEPASSYFKPRGIPLSSLETVALTLDEFEAVRLADLEGLYQEQAAAEMNVSRQTFGRIVEAAHKKIAEALIDGKALEIKGGEIEMVTQREFRCNSCGHRWGVPHGTGRPAACPQCQSADIHRVHEAGGPGRSGNWGRGAGRGRGRHRGRCGTQRAQSGSPEGGTQ
jgi:predicted DNA-binding protein (UPF0251 family)